MKVVPTGVRSGHSAPEGSLLAGRFRVAQTVRHSPSSTAYLAEDIITGRDIFLRLIPTDGASPGAMARMEQEAAVLEGIGSPRISSLLAHGQEKRHFWFAFSRPAGRSLASHLRSARLDCRPALELFRSLLSGLRELHGRGLLHRSLRPDSLFLEDLKQPAGVEIAGYFSPDAVTILQREGSHTPRLIDVVRYLPPEQTGVVDEPLSEASNLYSAGCILFECLSGRTPFEGTSLNELLHRQATRPAPQIREIGVPVPRVVDEILQRCLARDSRVRYQSVEAVEADVEALLERLNQGETDPDLGVGAQDRRGVLVESAFVARAEELRQLNEAFAATLAGDADLTFVEGESGFGKTRLLSEFSVRISQTGALVLRGRATTESSHQPLEVIDGVAAGVMTLAHARPELEQRLRSRLSTDLPLLAESLPTLGPLASDASGIVGDAGPGGESRTLGAIARLFDALGTPQEPVVILLDDCQWAADLVHRLLQHWRVVQADRPAGTRHVQIVVSFRADEVPPSHPLRRVPHAHMVRVGALGADDIRRLAESMAGRLPEAALETVIRLSDGVPFMASAILHGLVETQAILPGPEGWRVDESVLTQAGFATQAASFLSRRLDLLAPEVRRFLAAGAVLGRTFDLKFAMELSGVRAEGAFAAAQEARQRHLLWLNHHDGSGTFSHDRIRESLLGQLTEEEIRRLHRQVADYLETAHPDRIAELAHHFDAAGEHPRALRYAVEAARRAHQHHALELAEEQYRIAQRGVTGAARSTQFLVADGLGEVLMLRGKYEGAQRLFDLAARLADGPAAEADVRSKQGELYMKRGDMEAAAQEFERGLALLGASIPRNRVSLGIKLVVEAVVQVAHTLLPRLFVHTRMRTPDPRERLALRLYSGLSHACWYCRSLPLAMWAHLRGMNCGEVFLPSLELAQIYSNHAPAMVLTAAYRRGEQYALKSLQIRRQLGDQWGQGQSYHYHGIVLYAAARYDECIEKCRQSIQILERMGDLWQVHIARYQIAACLYRLGDLEGALEECRRNYASGITLGDEQASGIILDVWVRATGGSLPPHIIDQELARSRTDAQGQAQVLLAKAIQLIATGDPLQAVELLERARETVRRAGVSNPYTLPIRAWLVTAWRTSAQADASLGPARRTAGLRRGAWELRKAMLEAWRYPHELPHLYRELGLIEAMLGRPRRAWRAFEKSLRAAERLDAQVESAVTRTARARLSREMGWTDPAPPVNLRAARLRSGDSLIRRLESALRIGEEAAPTISLVDRFDMLLKSGRTITSALSFTLIGKAVQTAAERLLRSERVFLVPVDAQGHPSTPSERGGLDYDEALVLRAIELRQVVSAEPSERTGLRNAHAALCAPVMVRGDITCVLYSVCPDLRQAVGTDEERIADFIATLAGAALENAEGFQQLQQLNATLEERVRDRTAAVQERAEQLAASNEELARVANELREAEVQLVASTHAAQDANRAKSRFLAAMSHEIRTPMNGIIGMAELALSTELTERQRGYLNTVGRSARSLLAMLNDVLDFSKIEAGKMDIDAIPFDLHETVADAARLLAVPIAAKGLDLDVRIAADVPAQATGDPNRLRQILVNLIGNALKFTSRGRIGITVTRESQPAGWGLAETGQIHFVVTDTGIGISPQNQQRIFEAFDQGEASVTRRFGGTGLGLSISSQLVALMHGRIWVESQEGVGSAFHVALPLPVSPVLMTTVAGPSAAREAESWVVFARDPSVVALHEQRLSATGREVWGTSLFSEAKSHYFERPASARPLSLLIDLPLQAAHELSLIERLIDEQHVTPADVVALIPGGAEAIYQALAGRGIQAIIEKPVTPAALVEVLDRRSASAGLPVATDSAAAPTDTGLRILVVDDSEVNRDVAEGLLEMLGHLPATADSGAAALERLAAEVFDVVLMDIEMPEMDGLTAARRYRDQEGETETPLPILAMTAHAAGGFHRECEKAGMTGLIHKPVQPEELKRILAAIPARTVR